MSFQLNQEVLVELLSKLVLPSGQANTNVDLAFVANVATLEAGLLRDGNPVVLTGATAGATLTTDSAANLLSLLDNPSVGSLVSATLVNLSGQAVSLAAGAGVTISPGGVDVPNNNVSEVVMVVTNVATPALLVVNSLLSLDYGVAVSPFPPIQKVDIDFAAGAAATLSANLLLSGNVLNMTNAGAGPTLTTDTAANFQALLSSLSTTPAVGDSFSFDLNNTSGQAMTVAAGTGVTLTGTLTGGTLANTSSHRVTCLVRTIGGTPTIVLGGVLQA